MSRNTSVCSQTVKPRTSSSISLYYLTRLIGVGEARAKVVDEVQVTAVLYTAPGLSERLLGDLVYMLPGQAEVVAIVGTQHLLEDVLVIRRVLSYLGTVDETLDLTKGGTQRTKLE